MSLRRAFVRIVSLAVSFVLLLPLATGWGNMAAPPKPETVRHGSRVGEPAGGVRDVTIERETLHIDLRPLADAKPARVDATYRLRNDGPARTLDLLFVANGLANGGGSVTVDGRPVAAAPGQPAATLPASWRAPGGTPALPHADDAETRAPLPYEPRAEGTIAFRAPLGPGRHEVRVRYPAEASAYLDDDLTPVWQLGYVVAPAAAWAGFGGADVRIDVPRGWWARVNDPALRRDGNALVGRWAQVPPQPLAISVQKPPPSSAPYYAGWLLLCALALAGCAWLGARTGRWLRRRGRTTAWAIPLSLALTLGWTILGCVAFFQVPELVRHAASPIVSDYRVRAIGYGASFLLILIIPAMLLLGVATIQLAAVVGAKRAPTD